MISTNCPDAHKKLRGACAALFLFLAACPAGQKPSARTSEPAPSRKSEEPAEETSMFGRRDTPPAGVQKRQHFLIGIAPHSYLCTVAMRSSRGPVPMIYVYPKELKQLDQLTICLGGLPGGVDVQVEISSPSGRVRRRVFKTTDGGTARWDLQILPPGPPGAYTVSVAQGKLRLGETVKVKKATKPRMVVVPRKARSG